jgi:hypothetical protein
VPVVFNGLENWSVTFMTGYKLGMCEKRMLRGISEYMRTEVIEV